MSEKVWLVSKFTSNGQPATGLNPTLYVYDLSDNSIVLNGVTMLEVANGGYKYDFTSLFDIDKDYFFFVDGGDTLKGCERYGWGTSVVTGDINVIRKVEKARWKITDNNQMIFYDSDGTTPFLTFDLKDANGDPVNINPMERVPV